MEDTSDDIKPPSTLKSAGKRLWNAIQSAYAIRDAAGLSLLLSACRAEDSIEEYRRIVAQTGPVSVDRFGQERAHVLLAAIRDCESVKRQSLKALNLDPEPEPPSKVRNR